MEIQTVQEGSNNFVILLPTSTTPVQMYEWMVAYDLDALMDLCKYTGTSMVVEIMVLWTNLQQDQKASLPPYVLVFIG